MQVVAQTLNPQALNPTLDQLIAAFFQETAGDWHSQRRYYTLDKGVIQEVDSLLSIRFLAAQSEPLRELARLHNLPEGAYLSCGAQVTWESTYCNTNRKPATGSTVFGVHQGLLLRDRGFATTKPVTATYTFSNDRTLCLHTEYRGSRFDEEVKLVGTQYRTRQSIISREGQEVMIGQYLEKRV